MNKYVRDGYESAFSEYRTSALSPGASEKDLWISFIRRVKEHFHLAVFFHRGVLDVMLQVLERAEINETV